MVIFLIVITKNPICRHRKNSYGFFPDDNMRLRGHPRLPAEELPPEGREGGDVPLPRQREPPQGPAEHLLRVGEAAGQREVRRMARDQDRAGPRRQHQEQLGRDPTSGSYQVRTPYHWQYKVIKVEEIVNKRLEKILKKIWLWFLQNYYRITSHWLFFSSEILITALRNTEVNLNLAQYPTCPRLVRHVVTPGQILPVHYDSMVRIGNLFSRCFQRNLKTQIYLRWRYFCRRTRTHPRRTT